ncbi:MAG: LysR family transcriptional regulator [Plesiomonas sp.]
MRLKIEDMVMFSKVAEKLSFSHAAVELKIPQSTLSRRIRLFEEELNIPLFDRSKRQVTLSKEGSEVLEYCRDIVNKKSELENFIESSYHTNSGKLVIVASHNTAQELSTHFIGQFLEKNPNVSIEFKTMYDGYGEFDGDILLASTLPKNESLVATKVSSVKKTFFAAPEYFKRYGKPQSLHDLSTHKILYVRNPFYPDISESYSEDVFKTQHNKVVYSDIAQALHVSLKGEGILWVSTYFIKKQIDSGKLEMLFDDSTSIELPGYAIYKPRFIQPHKITSFIKAIKEYAKSIEVNTR